MLWVLICVGAIILSAALGTLIGKAIVLANNREGTS